MRHACLISALVVGLPALAAAQDSDGDGVLDAADALPCDPGAAGEAFAPAADQMGLLLFEDEWPGESDLDFNDVAVAYHYAVRTDGAGRAVAIRATLHPLALGGIFSHGLGLHLPIPASAVASVTRAVGGQPAEALAPRATDSELYVDVVADLRAHFGAGSGQVNSVAGQPAVDAAAVQVDVRLSTPTALAMAQAPFDVFVFRAGDRGHEIHRAPYAGSAAMDATLFGSGRDASGPGRHFVDVDGLPYVLDLPQDAAYPQEAVPISGLYPDILAFAASAGATHADFYATNVQSVNAFTGAPAPSLLTGATRADLTCLPAGAPCASLRAQGLTQSGVYRVDPDGAGGLGAFDVYCDMQTAGGGWTLISNRRAGTTNREACGSRLQDFFTQGCGAPHSVGPGDSYALDRARRAAVIAAASEVLIIQYLNGVPDTDDAYIMELPSPGVDLFPNRSTVRDFPIARVCTLDGARCDASSVYFKYTGDSWYHSSYCRASNWAGSTAYRGNYGLCHDGWTSASSSYFTGDRAGYSETKLWGHSNLGASHQERIFYR